MFSLRALHQRISMTVRIDWLTGTREKEFPDENNLRILIYTRQKLAD